MDIATDMRIVLMDGTRDGVVLVMFEDVSAAAIPGDYSRLRIQNQEGLYEVAESGVHYWYYTSGPDGGPRVRVSVFVNEVVKEVPEEAER